MKWYRGPQGDQRIWLEPAEIELTAEDELKKADLLPTADNPVTDLERFVEGYLDATLDQYADLEPDVLGLTHFDTGKRPAISLNRDLTGSALDSEDARPGLVGRWRATLAHEACHILFHRILFELDLDQDSLFPEPESRSELQGLMRCLKREVGYTTRAHDWREVQANRGMAALLLPRKVFQTVVLAETAELGLPTEDLRAGTEPTNLLVDRLSERFAVSKQAASIRLATLGFVTRADVAPLPFS